MLRGGDGGRFESAADGAPRPAMMAKKMAFGGAMRAAAVPMAAACYGAPPQGDEVGYAGGADYSRLFARAAGPVDATEAPGVAFCRGAAVVLLPAGEGAAAAAEGPGAGVAGTRVVSVPAKQLAALLARALGGAGPGPDPAAFSLAKLGYTTAAVVAWCPSDPSHAVVARVAVGSDGGERRAAAEEACAEVARDVGLKRPAPEPGAVCAQVRGVGRSGMSAGRCRGCCWARPEHASYMKVPCAALATTPLAQAASAHAMPLAWPHPTPRIRPNAQALSVTPLAPGASMYVPDPSSAAVNVFASLDKAALLFAALMERQERRYDEVRARRETHV